MEICWYNLSFSVPYQITDVCRLMQWQQLILISLLLLLLFFLFNCPAFLSWCSLGWIPFADSRDLFSRLDALPGSVKTLKNWWTLQLWDISMNLELTAACNILGTKCLISVYSTCDSWPVSNLCVRWETIPLCQMFEVICVEWSTEGSHQNSCRCEGVHLQLL